MFSCVLAASKFGFASRILSVLYLGYETLRAALNVLSEIWDVPDETNQVPYIFKNFVLFSTTALLLFDKRTTNDLGQRHQSTGLGFIHLHRWCLSLLFSQEISNRQRYIMVGEFDLKISNSIGLPITKTSFQTRNSLDDVQHRYSVRREENQKWEKNCRNWILRSTCGGQ